MKRKLGMVAAVTAMFLTAFSHADAAPTAREKIGSVQYLVGSWSCVHTVGTFSGTYTTTYANALGDLWLKQTYDFPPPQMQEAGPAVHGEFFIGYDEGRQAWVRFGAMSSGKYFANRMTETGDGGWSWKYIGFFSRTAAETPGSDATFTKKSDSEYEVNGPSYEMNGKRVTEHHMCKKM